MRTQHENATPSRENASQETSSQGLETGILTATRPGDRHQNVQLAANTSAPVQQLMAFQAAADNSPQVRQLMATQAGTSAAVQRRADPLNAPAMQMQEDGSENDPFQAKLNGSPLPVQRVKSISEVVPPGVKATPTEALLKYNAYLANEIQGFTISEGFEQWEFDLNLEILAIARKNILAMETPNSKDIAAIREEMAPVATFIRKYEEAHPKVEKAQRASKKRDISESIWNHITKGGTKEDGRPTGLHTIHGEGQIAEGFGPKTPVGDHGCYTQAVRLISEKSKLKKKDSTFFPDSWTLEDIREAIEGAYSGDPLEVITPLKGEGMKLHFNGDSYFPIYE